MKDIVLSSESRIVMVGDSIVAGRGSSDCDFAGEYIIKFDGRKYYRQIGRKCWASILSDYLTAKYPGISVVNNGCKGVTSNHLYKYKNDMIPDGTTLVIIMVGSNNRKIPVGMALLYNDLRRLIRNLRLREAEVLLLSPPPSTRANEMRGDRRFHMNDVDETLRTFAEEMNVDFLSLYDHFTKYIDEKGITIDDFMMPQEEINGYGLPESEDDYTVRDWNRVPDGHHPPDSVHRMIAEYIIEKMHW